MTSTAILIPSRYNSSRFPGKALTDLGGMTMIERVYKTCAKTGLDTYVLTDDMRIFNLFGERSAWIDQRVKYANGTERCAGAISDENFTTYLGDYDQYINVQGDMPDVTIEMIKRVGTIIEMSGVATAWTEMDPDLQADPNSVKVVHNNVYSHWFGRGLTCGSRHLGIYGYSKKALTRYGNMPSDYEKHEGLEQLRWFSLNYRVAVTRVDFNGMEINTPDDGKKWNSLN